MWNFEIPVRIKFGEENINIASRFLAILQIVILIVLNFANPIEDLKVINELWFSFNLPPIKWQ